MEQSIRKIFDHYGARHQAKKLMEETAELIEAIEDFVDCASSKTMAHVVEEIADCMVVINQLYLVYVARDGKIDHLGDTETRQGENASEAIARLAANIISGVAHLENTERDKDILVDLIKDYIVWLHLISSKLEINQESIKNVMSVKIDRQLTRMEMNK